MATEKFYREEQKYVLTKIKYAELKEKIQDKIEKDNYYHEKICNVYFDNENNELISKSLDKPKYKEKVRLRSYNTPDDNDLVFLEIKKKYNGIVNKRRVIITYQEAKDYINKKIIPNTNKQIMKEIDYCFQKYNLIPKISITYDRLAYKAMDDPELRITFDYNLKSSTRILELSDLDDEKEMFGNIYIMEVKSLRSLPEWFVKTLSELKIYPKSFSKYGEIYKKIKESDLYV